MNPRFDELGECERCRKSRQISANGICEECLEYLVAIRGNEYFRDKELKRIAQAENGAIQFARRILLGRTSQADVELRSGIEIQARKDDQREQARLQRIMEAKPQQLTLERAKARYIPEILEVSDELLSKLNERPDLLYQLDPRKFEEVMAELMTRIGFEDVRLTPASRDGGRDVLAKFRVPTGMLFVITECKRYAARRPVGLPIIERFLFTIRDNDRATFGMLATTSSFTRDAEARAEEYKAQLHLAGFEHIKHWLSQSGTWQKSTGGNLWIPPSA
jgi:restriction endonuclease Mrr